MAIEIEGEPALRHPHVPSDGGGIAERAILAEGTVDEREVLHLRERDELLPGRLIVLEGTDGVGRSTQVRMLRSWLECSGHAVAETEITHSILVGPGLKKAKEQSKPGPLALTLFYATDFVDRFEKQILPALRSGFLVLADRYIYSLMARALVRGANPRWLHSIYGVALKPDAIFYLKIGLEDLLPRMLQQGGFDYWESGMDMRLGEDLFESFVIYQQRLLAHFDAMAEASHFQVLDASQPVATVFEQLQERLFPLLPQG
ncbi:MAG TPA: thymidylate kinase [Ktedonobacteraceae bacterium]|nr:thymidylate kinase [Ktedonobacteraceae bacterium]